MEQRSQHIVAVIGGACAGAEVAAHLADQGVEVVVFDQGRRPYGKIEDGLPRWHRAQRLREYGIIDDKLDRPLVHYVPLTRIGEDVEMEALIQGYSAVVLACGAWRDRPFPLPQARPFVGRGLVYQNELVRWYNHLESEDAVEAPVEIADGALIVGGGLASVDVAKLHMFELIRRALALRGLPFDCEAADKLGVDKILAQHDLAWEDLGIEGVTIFYRRRLEDMPLMTMPEGASAEKVAKVEAARVKIIERSIRKYRFNVEPLARPADVVVEGGQLVGVIFDRMTVEPDGVLKPTGEQLTRRGPYVVSSIGSIPEPIPGVPMRGELFDFEDWDLGRLTGLPTVFGAGNVVTGKGNVIVSRRHGGAIGAHVAAHLMGVSEALEDGPTELTAAAPVARAKVHAEGVAALLSSMTPPPVSQREATLAAAAARQATVGYTGDYRTWVG